MNESLKNARVYFLLYYDVAFPVQYLWVHLEDMQGQTRKKYADPYERDLYWVYQKKNKNANIMLLWDLSVKTIHSYAWLL